MSKDIEQDLNIYSLKVFCTNCDHKWDLSLPKGRPFDSFGTYNPTIYCPNCDCATVRRAL